VVGLIGVGPEFDAHPPGLDVRDRGLQSDDPGPSANVPLPPAPRNRPALLEQMAVTGMQLLGRAELQRRVDTERDAAEQTPVGDQEQQLAVALTGRPQQAQIRLELDVPFGGARRDVEVDDPGVGGRERIDGKLRHRRDPCVRRALVGLDHRVA
jgi:hypothetical protein